jgi:hypothetical protein
MTKRAEAPRFRIFSPVENHRTSWTIKHSDRVEGIKPPAFHRGIEEKQQTKDDKHQEEFCIQSQQQH